MEDSSENYIEITSSDQFKNLVNNNKYVIVDFTATWCPPCKAIAPVYKKWSKEDKHKHIVFLKVDVDEQHDIAAAYEIHAMPTFLFFEDQKVTNKILGARQHEILNTLGAYPVPEQKIDENLVSSDDQKVYG